MSDRGDKGLTLGECSMEISKNSPFVRVVGMVDELQARVASVRVLLKDGDNENLEQIEKDLYQIMGSIYKSLKWDRGEERIVFLDSEIKFYGKKYGNPKKFLLPGGNELVVRLNFCRTGCRLAEEELVLLKETHEKEKKYFDENILKYINKLSTYFYWLWIKNIF